MSILRAMAPVLVLRSLGAAHDHDAARDVLQADGRLHLVDVLPALAAGAHRRDLHVFFLDLDVDLVLDVGGHLDGGEGRLPARVRVERGDAHQAVHAVLAPQVAERVVARDAEARAVDPGLVALLVVDDLGLEAAALAPAQVHAQEHLRPVLRVVAARARVDADDGVRVVDGAREHPGELGVAHPRVERRELRRRPRRSSPRRSRRRRARAGRSRRRCRG